MHPRDILSIGLDLLALLMELVSNPFVKAPGASATTAWIKRQFGT